MAQWLENEQFGNGSDGNYAPSTSTDAPIDSACTGTISTKSLSATNASFSAGQIILIHQTKGSGAGHWELNRIASYIAGTITTKYPLTYSYASGAQVLVVKQYANVNIGSGITLTGKSWNDSKGGIIVLLANGNTTITGALRVNGGNGSSGNTGSPAPGKVGGLWGGQGDHVNNDGYSAGSPGQISNNGGGGASQYHFNTYSGDGAGGGNGTAGGNGTVGSSGERGVGGIAVGNAALTSMFMGGGGGGTCGEVNQVPNGGGGGSGGGIIIILSPTITITGSISVNGGSGGGTQVGAGGGAGGSVLLKGKVLTLGSGKITASGGLGGSGTGGGNGGVGRIHADYQDSISGTTSPTLDSSQANLASGFFGGMV